MYNFKNSYKLQVTSYKLQCSGFTLIEILIVIGITLIIAATVVPIYGNLQVSAQLNENTSQIIQTLRIAKQRSLARVNSSTHGVYFQPGSYTLYQGASYATRNSSYDRTTSLSAVTISTNLSGDEVNFSTGLGQPNTTGLITLTHESSGTRSISVNSLGSIEEN